MLSTSEPEPHWWVLGRTKDLSVDIHSQSIHWALWTTLMKREYFSFFYHTTSILAKLSTCCFEHSGDMRVSLLVNMRHSEYSWEGRNTCLWIYALNLLKEHSGEHWWVGLSTAPQAFWQTSTPGALNTLVTSVVRYKLVPATLISPGKEETRACWYTLSIY